MLKQFKSLFSNGDQSDGTDQEAMALAAAVLMFEVSRADGEVDPLELETLSHWLKTELGMSNDTAQNLTETAQEVAENAISLQRFTRTLCEELDIDKRRHLVEYCWRIALVDNELDAHERHTIRKIAGLLYLNDKDIILAKEAAKKVLA